MHVSPYDDRLLAMLGELAKGTPDAADVTKRLHSAELRPCRQLSETRLECVAQQRTQ